MKVQNLAKKLTRYADNLKIYEENHVRFMTAANDMISQAQSFPSRIHFHIAYVTKCSLLGYKHVLNQKLLLLEGKRRFLQGIVVPVPIITGVDLRTRPYPRLHAHGHNTCALVNMRSERRALYSAFSSSFPVVPIRSCPVVLVLPKEIAEAALMIGKRRS